MSEVAINNSLDLAADSERDRLQHDNKNDFEMDLFVLRQVLADDLRNFEAEGRANEDKEAVSEAIKSLDSMKLDEMTRDEIFDIKQRIEQLIEQVSCKTEKKNGLKKMLSRLGFKKRASKSSDLDSKTAHPGKKEVEDAADEKKDIQNLFAKDEASGDDLAEDDEEGEKKESEQPILEESAETHISPAKSMERASSAASKKSILSRLSMRRSPSTASKKSVGEKSTASSKSKKTADAEDTVVSKKSIDRTDEVSATSKKSVQSSVKKLEEEYGSTESSPKVELDRNASLSSKRSIGSAVSKKTVLSTISTAATGAGAPKILEKRQSSLKQPTTFDRQRSQGSVTWMSSFEQAIQMTRSVSTTVNENGEVEMEDIAEKPSTEKQSE